MSILYLMPRWKVISERWMYYMIETLGEDLHAVGTWQGHPPANWPLRVKAIPFLVPSIPRRVGARLRLIDYDDRGKAGRRRLRKLLRSRHVAAVLVQYLTLAVRLEDILCDSPVPVLVQCHGIDVCFDYRQPDGSPLYSPDYRQRAQRLSEHVLLLANSQYTKSLLISAGFRPERIRVTYLPVPIPHQRASRVAQPTDTHSTTFLFLGRFVDCKGPLLTIRAFERACEHGAQAKLLMAGDGPLLERCQTYAETTAWNDRITFFGAVEWPQADKLRHRADVLVAHSCRGQESGREECLGISFLEAMAAGIPVLTGRSGALPEYVHHGKTGFLFSPGDIDAQARWILRLSEDAQMRRQSGCAAREVVQREFSPSTWRRRLAQLGIL